jgi:hypothetical protein
MATQTDADIDEAIAAFAACAALAGRPVRRAR